MHFAYGRANGNALEAQQLYVQLSPERTLPHHGIFTRIHQCLRENDNFFRKTVDCGRVREVRTVPLEEAILNLI